MNNNVKLYLAKMYGFIIDAIKICEDEKNNYDIILKDKKNQLALSMCILQIGELANKIKQEDKEMYKKYNFHEPKGMRDRIVHGYGMIDFDIVKETLKVDIPILKKVIEDIVEKKYLDNPYLLYDQA